MYKFSGKMIFAGAIILFIHLAANGQVPFSISGKITNAAMQPLPNVTIHFAGRKGGCMTRADGSFTITTNKWSDTMVLSHAGFETLAVALHKEHLNGLSFKLMEHVSLLDNVVVRTSGLDTEPGKHFMKKVIANKSHNNPDRFRSYSYTQYGRHEVDISNIDSAQKNNKGLKNLTINIYRSMDSANAKALRCHCIFQKPYLINITSYCLL